MFDTSANQQAVYLGLKYVIAVLKCLQTTKAYMKKLFRPKRDMRKEVLISSTIIQGISRTNDQEPDS